MRKLFLMAGLTLATAPVIAIAHGCIKGAAVGGVAGHVAGHHAVAGTAIGCIVGHHQAKDNEMRAKQVQAASPPPAASR